jgi:hypothetical protein
MRRYTARVLLIMVAAVCALTVAWAQAASRGTVNGSVTGSAGPLVGVKVVITSAISGYTANSTTDPNGAFSFRDAPVGGVEVKALDATGKVLGSAKGTLNFAGDVITVPVKLP